MLKIKNLLLVGLALLMNLGLQAQANTSAGAAEDVGFMRSEAKVYVVMVVVITILAGLLIYLVRLDKKISRLEKGNVAD